MDESITRNTNSDFTCRVGRVSSAVNLKTIIPDGGNMYICEDV